MIVGLLLYLAFFSELRILSSLRILTQSTLGSEFIGRKFNWNFFLMYSGQVVFIRKPPNQSLKLTEVAVDDFAARHFAENDMISRYIRAMNYMELSVRRRSLAPVR
jgi:hypothetical protein